jgi:hypothetical protein
MLLWVSNFVMLRRRAVVPMLWPASLFLRLWADVGFFIHHFGIIFSGGFHCVEL